MLCVASARILLLLALSTNVPRVGGAQAPRDGRADSGTAPLYVHEQWTVREGLPVNSVNALLQSRSGYLWIATFDGLVRFDGVRMVVFSSASSAGLESNRILALRETADGAIWLWTELGTLVRLLDGVFTPMGAANGLTEVVTALHSDGDGVLSVGTARGILVLRGERFEPLASGAFAAPVEHIAGRRTNELWIATSDRRLYTLRDGTLTQVALDAAVSSDAILDMDEDVTGSILLATSSGMSRIDRGSGVAQRLLRIDAPFAAPLHLLTDSIGADFYSSGSSLYRNGSRVFALPAAAGRSPASTPQISALLRDHEGSLWIGSTGAGLHRLKLAPFRTFSEAEGLSYRSVQSVFEDRDGSLLIGTRLGGTNRLHNGRVKPLPSASRFPATALSFLRDRRGRLWVGGGSGLFVCSSFDARCDEVEHEAIRSVATYAMHEAAEGTLWFGTPNGLVLLDPSGNWSRVGPEQGAPTALVRVFARTRDGALWMGTAGGGLSRYHSGRFMHLGTANGLPINLVRSLYEDADGWLWVGTEGRGLVRLNPAACSDNAPCPMVHYETADGLRDAVIHQMLEDDFGRLWMSGNRGISWVRRSDLLAFANGTITQFRATAYTERDGLKNREANGGNQPAGVKDADGRLWFPTQDGVVVVDPSSISRNAVPPRVVVEQVSANGVALPGHDGTIALARHQRDVEIAYTALSFLAPEEVRFRYRMDRPDAVWTDAGTRRAAYFTNLAPGNYTFRVIASNNDGVWNEQGASISVYVAPRLHETRTARVLFVLALLLAAEGGRRWRIRRLQKRADELQGLIDASTATLRQREAQLATQNTQLGELHEARSRLFANLTHEFRSPLTLILGPLRSLLDGRHGVLLPTAREQGTLMLRNGERLLSLTNQVLELAKVQSGVLAMHPQRMDVTAFTRAAVREFQSLAETRGVSLNFSSDEPASFANADADHLEKALFNLLSNALKFTRRGDVVDTCVRANRERVEIVVRDSGIGISPTELPRIFDRYFQAGSSTSTVNGTGIGLALAKELVELMGGSIRAESAPGTGSTFTIDLPVAVAMNGAEGASALAHGALHADMNAELHAERHAEQRSMRASRTPASASVDRSRVEDRTTVLVVDDDADLRAFVRSVLGASYHVLEAVDGESALATVREALPDVIVADVTMPGLDGLALGRALKEDPMTEAIPMILLTARAAPADQIAGLEAGADAYLIKPFEPSVLEAQVGSLVAQRHRLRELFRQPALAQPLPPAPSISELERRLRPLVEQHLSDPTFGPESLAHSAGLSYHQLYRGLRDELAMSPSRFIRTVRVERAAELLRQRAGSVTEVAYASGFESLSYFSRVFRERFGTTPTEHASGLERQSTM